MALRVVRKVASPGTLHSPMISYIRKHYSGVLGEDIALLDEPDGLEKLQERCWRRFRELSELGKAA